MYKVYINLTDLFDWQSCLWSVFTGSWLRLPVWSTWRFYSVSGTSSSMRAHSSSSRSPWEWWRWRCVHKLWHLTFFLTIFFFTLEPSVGVAVWFQNITKSYHITRGGVLVCSHVYVIMETRLLTSVWIKFAPRLFHPSFYTQTCSWYLQLKTIEFMKGDKHLGNYSP